MREVPVFDPPEVIPRPVEYESSDGFIKDLEEWEHAREQLRLAQHNVDAVGGYAIDMWEGRYEESFRRLESYLGSEDLLPSLEMEQLIETMNSTQKVALFGVMSHILWLDWQTHGDRAFHDLTRYEDTYTQYEHLFALGMKVAAEQADKAVLKECWRGLLDIDEGDRGFGMLLDERLSDEARLVGVVEYINTFGFIPAIDRLATAITQSDHPGALKILYERLQGQQVEEVRAFLSEVYEHVDYRDYALAEKNITQEEGDRLESIVHSDSTLFVRKHDDVHFLDLASGPGRNTLEMLKRGYSVTAIDYEDKHILQLLDAFEEKMESGEFSGLDEEYTDPDRRLLAEMGNWFDLVRYWGMNAYNRDLHTEKPAATVDILYSLGRSLAHARTMHDMFLVWGQIRQVLADGGHFVFDMPELNGDQQRAYDEKVKMIRDNLEVIGVENLDENLIFDGPSATERFNRQVLDEGQIKDLAYLMGFRLESVESVEMDDGKFVDRYYHLKTDEAFDPAGLDRHQVGEALMRLGLLKVSEDVNFNTMIEPWGVTLGQVWFWLDGGEDGIREWRYRNEIRKARGEDPAEVVSWNIGNGEVELRVSAD